jgi:hypothetical protein
MAANEDPVKRHAATAAAEAKRKRCIGDFPLLYRRTAGRNVRRPEGFMLQSQAGRKRVAIVRG